VSESDYDMDVDRKNTKEAIHCNAKAIRDDQVVVNQFLTKNTSNTLKKYGRDGADKIRRRLGKFSMAAAPHKFDEARRRNSLAPGPTINISKCAVISISSRVPGTSHSYFLYGISISHHETSCVNLRVTISHNCAFKDHIVSHRTSRLFRGFSSRNIDSLTRAFIIYIRPIIKDITLYGTQLLFIKLTYWGPGRS
jgi:hypothetical protein